MRPTLLAVALIVMLAGCGDSQEPKAKALALGQTAELKRGTIDTMLAAETVTDPYVPEGPRPQPGRHFVGVSLKWTDNGEPFHHDWARFTLVDDAGKTTTVAVLTPLKQTHPGEPAKGQPQTQVVALEVADGHKPSLLTLGSADERWRFSARWSLER